MTLQSLQAAKGVEEKLLLATRELVNKNKILKVLCKLHTEKIREAKELCLLEIFEAESQVIEQQSLTKVPADAAYDLFRQFVCGKTQLNGTALSKTCIKKTVDGHQWVKDQSSALVKWASF
jgi:hypothetical protein